ncbi:MULTISPECIES: HNH endonuclease [unclassified Hydrogenobaculum]|jgi:Restriction endonuclease|uniref:HNH endonuclease n=1 Tax=unclassified Hydrogenobaculum TaxID=2622382 RepID=UPI0001C5029B|nr:MULTISPECIES: HNH endonuclease [unclassified Hydrogenobaculum]AEF18479.1 HNH endonuclease [Hydrogenobaculum sp. 3684]AEG45769.1 HNH endonuclease [Hydrogenobaculum sp. SHO]AGG14411.1 HNH endonuclease [Hydrogenobaculum sp. HO]AGH92715.1 restriction endonuclease [Hydrogenobaculum sp. SN]
MKLYSLLLDRTYKPLTLLDYRKSFLLEYTQRATVLEYHPEAVIRSTYRTYKVPIVLKTNALSKTFYKNIPTRYNVYVRDNFTCGYCGKVCDDSEITVDHIVPVSKGGKWTWDNLVTACESCNAKKSDNIIMPIYIKPHKPQYFTLLLKEHLKKIDETTLNIIKPYCYQYLKEIS